MGARSRWQWAAASALAGIVVAMGCRQIVGLDGLEYVEGLCQDDAGCDDGNACTEDTCGEDAVCVHTARVGAPCEAADGATTCNGAGQCAKCGSKADCDGGIPESACHSFDCVAEACVAATRPDGPLAVQVAGDCHVQRCDGGLLVEEVDDADVPVDGDGCTEDVCEAGAASNPPASAGTPCGTGGALQCDGAGACKGCTEDAQCAGGTDCKSPACDTAGQVCTFENVAAGTVVPTQTAGDCALVVCDGGGGTASELESGDPQDDGNECTTDTCLAVGMTAHAPVPPGEPCDAGEGTVCDGAGHCVGQPCSGPGDCAAEAQCVDGVCCASECEGTCQACSAAKKGAGPDGLCGPILAGDPDGTDCPGNAACSAGACATLEEGAPCLGVPGECASGLCVDGVCCDTACDGVCVACNLPGSIGACGSVSVGEDPAGECPNGACGAGVCLLDNGQGCTAPGDCLSGRCVDGVCCNTTCTGTCQACTAAKTGGVDGTCASVKAMTDPDDECVGATTCNGGNGCTKLPLGTPCTQGTECSTGSCVDGFCCNTSCTNDCRACNLPGSEGACTPVPYGQDPKDACGGNEVCDGNGGCGRADGESCQFDPQCASDECVDGVCCNTSCNGACRACDLPGTVGTCTNVPANTDPDNECSGARVCNGNGVCVTGPNGAACSSSGECASGFCVDGVCCDTSCTGLCSACSTAKKGVGTVNGVCGPILNGNDPDGECIGPTTCSGFGTCH